MRLLILAMGASTHTRKWVKYFRDAGHEVMLVSFYPCEEISGVEVRVLRIRNRLAILMKLPALNKIIADFKPDLLHAHYASSCGVMAALSGYKPYILSTWGDDVMVFPNKSKLHRKAVSWAIDRADQVTATSKILHDRTVALSSNKRQVTVIPFGVDLVKFAFLEREAKETVHIGAVRWLTPKYGIEYLVRAVAKLVASDYPVKLTIIGLGPMRDELERLSSSLGLEEIVTFTGALPNREVIEYYHTFDIAVMPSVSEGETFGVAAVEAMATGLPVVASRVGGLPEVIVDGVTGSLVTPADVDSLAAGLEAYVNDADLRAEHGRNGRARVEQYFDWQKNGAMMAEIYERMLVKE